MTSEARVNGHDEDHLDRSVHICQRPTATYIGPLRLHRVLEDLPQHIDGSVGLDGDAGQYATAVDILDQLLGACLFLGRLLGALSSSGEGGFVVEAVEVAASALELLDPFLRLHHHRLISEGLVSSSRC